MKKNLSYYTQIPNSAIIRQHAAKRFDALNAKSSHNNHLTSGHSVVYCRGLSMDIQIDRHSFLEPLGICRNSIIDFVGGHNKNSPLFVSIDHDNVFEVYEDFVELFKKKVDESKDDKDIFVAYILLGAAELLNGNPYGALSIVEHVPEDSIKIDSHRNCISIAHHSILHALPLPEHLIKSYKCLGKPALSIRAHLP